jgi:hypothetical protein
MNRIGIGVIQLLVTAIVPSSPILVTLMMEAIQLLVIANVPSSPILVILMEAILSSETSVLTRATRRKIL